MPAYRGTNPAMLVEGFTNNVLGDFQIQSWAAGNKNPKLTWSRPSTIVQFWKNNFKGWRIAKIHMRGSHSSCKYWWWIMFRRVP